MIREVINELKKYTVGKKNTDKTEISVLALNRLIYALEEQESKMSSSENPNKRTGTIWENIDEEEISKSVVLLDLFTKTFCRYPNDYERFNDLKFRCAECPFQKENGDCLVKHFRKKFAPHYRNFGCMVH